MSQKGFLIIVAISGLSLLMSGCDNGNAVALQGENESLRTELKSAKDKSDDLERNDQVVKRELKQLKEQLDQAQQDRQKMEDTLKKLDREFSDYKQKYKVSVSNKIPGLPVAELVYRRKAYQNLTIRSVTNEFVTFEHSEGVIRVKKDELPPDLAGSLAMDQGTPVQAGLPAFLKEIEESKNGHRASSDVPMEAYSAVSPEGNAYSKLLRSIAIIRTEESTGSGFVATQGGRTYFFTNAHMLMNKNPKASIVAGPGKVVEVPMPKEVEISDEEDEGDIVRFELVDNSIPPLKILSNSEKLQPGQKIVALGNAGGAGVIPVLKGKTAGIGTFVVEVDAPFVHGNSGGPVVWEGTDIVIGVATRYETSVGGDSILGYSALPGSSRSGPRRLCVRPDKIGKWRTVPLEQICAEIKTVKAIDIDNQILKTLMDFKIIGEEQGAWDVRYVKPANYLFTESELAQNIAAQIRELEANLKQDRDLLKKTNAYWSGPSAARIDATTRQQKQQSAQKSVQSSVRSHFELFTSGIEHVYGADVTAVDPKQYCTFSRGMFKEVAKSREKVIEDLNKHFAEVVRQFNFDAF